MVTECVEVSVPAKHTAACNRRDWVGFSPRMDWSGDPGKVPPSPPSCGSGTVVLCVGISVLAAETLRSSARQAWSGQVSVLVLKVVLEG